LLPREDRDTINSKMKWWRWTARLILLSAALTAGNAEDTPDELLLVRFKERVGRDLAQVLNYTCLETMRRAERRPKSPVFVPMDTVRLEVSKVGGKELFSWPGASHFEDKGLKAFLATGATTTGMFGLAAHELFISGSAELKYHGEETLASHRAVRYDFHLPQDHGYEVRMGDATGQVAANGSFWFDPVSLDLIRIQSHGVDIPADLHVGELSATISYARVPMGRARALLPRDAEVVLADSVGGASRNTIEFSQCHEYQTESTISFDVPAVLDSATPQPAMPEVHLPAGLMVPATLETAIDSKTSAIGDPVRGKVRDDVRRDGKVVLPAGAAIHGRIRRLDRHEMGESYFIVGVELFDVEWQNAHADFYGELVETYAKKGITEGFGVRGSVTCVVRGKKVRIEPGLGLLWRVLDRPSNVQ
jgi:hypothetical protein